MKNVIIVGLTDTYSFKILDQLEADNRCGSVKRMYTSLQFFREYKKGDADIVLMDNIPDAYPVDFGKKLRGIDSKVFIIRLFKTEDLKLDNLFKKSVPNSESISKIAYDGEYVETILGTKGGGAGSASGGGDSQWWQFKGGDSSGRRSDEMLEGAVGKTVLVVDDFENTLNVIKHSLERIGFSVISATSAKEALQILSKPVVPNIIITDLNMPQMDGFGFIEQVRTLPALEKIPIFILTTEFNLAKKIKAQALGIAGWIQKPYKTEEFLKIITKFIS